MVIATMNKMATAMQEGEYDSERPQRKVSRVQRSEVSSLDVLMSLLHVDAAASGFHVVLLFVSEASTCGAASGSSSS